MANRESRTGGLRNPRRRRTNGCCVLWVFFSQQLKLELWWVFVVLYWNHSTHRHINTHWHIRCMYYRILFFCFLWWGFSLRVLGGVNAYVVIVIFETNETISWEDARKFDCDWQRVLYKVEREIEWEPPMCSIMNQYLWKACAKTITVNDKTDLQMWRQQS